MSIKIKTENTKLKNDKEVETENIKLKQDLDEFKKELELEKADNGKFSIGSIALAGETFSFPIVLGERIIVKNNIIPFDQFNVGLLKRLILEERDDISSFKMHLWKVGTDETDENIEKLKNTEIDIKNEFGGDKLNDSKLVQNVFSVTPPEERIHIIVQPLSTTGQVRINIQSCNLDYLPRQDGYG
ncbi:11230_t:CDS:2, partial [Ambispora leptoticha]